MDNVYAQTRGVGVSPILGLGIFFLVIPFIGEAVANGIPFSGFIKGFGIFLIVVGLVHQVLMNLAR